MNGKKLLISKIKYIIIYYNNNKTLKYYSTAN